MAVIQGTDERDLWRRDLDALLETLDTEDAKMDKRASLLAKQKTAAGGRKVGLATRCSGKCLKPQAHSVNLVATSSGPPMHQPRVWSQPGKHAHHSWCFVNSGVSPGFASVMCTAGWQGAEGARQR